MEYQDSLQRQEDGRSENRQERVEDLHLDRVVASQPEIGPTPPDGGYGWLIVTSAVIYNITVPSLLSLYGLIILKGIREEGHDPSVKMRIWDLDIALVPVIALGIRLLLESWCRAVVKICNMPRFIALAGLCLTVAGVLLSSFSTDAQSNDHILNIFAGIFLGAGCALTGQQTDVIITHYFREKLTTMQRIVRMAPSIGNVFIPLLIGYLCTVYTGDVVVMIYGAIIMQNCMFLASYTRPIYIEKVIRHTYNMLRDAVEDEDEVIFSNQNNTQEAHRQNVTVNVEPNSSNANDEDNDVVVFKSNRNAKEVMDPSISKENQNRFSSDFSTMYDNNNSNRFSSDFSARRFSSDFVSPDASNYGRVSGYRELENIDRDAHNPQPLYRETTVNAPQSIVFAAEVTPGTARRTASLRKNIITISNMLRDLNFYLYALLHLTTTLSVLILGLVFPPLIWEQNQSLNIWTVAKVIAVGHGSALCFTSMCVMLPKSINEKERLCGAICIIGAAGFYGITMTGSKSLLAVWCMFGSFSTAASFILQHSIYKSTLNEFDTTATMTASNLIVAIFILVWSLVHNYTYKGCFLTVSLLQTVSACFCFLSSFRRRR